MQRILVGNSELGNAGVDNGTGSLIDVVVRKRDALPDFSPNRRVDPILPTSA